MLRSVLLSLAGLTVLAVCAPPSPAAADAPTPKEIARIRRELPGQERDLARFEDLVGRFESAARQSSSSSRRRIVEDLEQAMGEAIVALEDRLREKYLLVRHGADADQVRTGELPTSHGVRTGRRQFYEYTGAGGPPPAYLRLTRQGVIYYSCQTIREQAITSQGSATGQFLDLAREFAGLLRADIEERRALLPPEADGALPAMPTAPAKPAVPESEPAAPDTTGGG